MLHHGQETYIRNWMKLSYSGFLSRELYSHLTEFATLKSVAIFILWLNSSHENLHFSRGSLCYVYTCYKVSMISFERVFKSRGNITTGIFLQGYSVTIYSYWILFQPLIQVHLKFHCFHYERLIEIIMHENFIIVEDINHEILCHFILFSLLIMSSTKMHYTVIGARGVLFLLECFNCFLLKLKSSHLKISIQILMYTVLKRTIFLTLSVDILCRVLLMQLCWKDILNNVSVSFK